MFLVSRDYDGSGGNFFQNVLNIQTFIGSNCFHFLCYNTLAGCIHLCCVSHKNTSKKYNKIGRLFGNSPNPYGGIIRIRSMVEAWASSQLRQSVAHLLSSHFSY